VRTADLGGHQEVLLVIKLDGLREPTQDARPERFAGHDRTQVTDAPAASAAKLGWTARAINRL
jgi:hypothetical protein